MEDTFDLFTKEDIKNKDAYVQVYLTEQTFDFSQRIEQEIGDIHIQITVMENEQGFEKAQVLLTQGDMRYECLCIDSHYWEEMFFSLNMEGKNYLCFRKTLYGFTLLNVETLMEEYDYFPRRVLEGDESFIFTDAVSFGRFVIFEGCYWGTPYFYCIYDYKTKRFFDIYHQFGVWSKDNGISVSNDHLRLECFNEKDEAVVLDFSYEEVCELMKAHGEADS